MRRSHIIKVIFAVSGIITSIIVITLARNNPPFLIMDDKPMGQTRVDVLSKPENYASPETSRIPEYSTEYIDGDWNNFIWRWKYEDLRKYETGDYPEDLTVNAYMRFGLTYGKSFFTDSKYKISDDSEPESRLIRQGLHPESETIIFAEGHIGDRITVFIDHDSRREQNENRYRVRYKAIDDDEVLREANIGDIKVFVNNSHYAVFDSGDRQAIGFDATFQKDYLTVKGFGSITKGEVEIEHFKGTNSSESVKIAEYQYMKNTYFQLEPFRRYDGLTSPPSISPSNNSYNQLLTFSSAAVNSDNITLANVDVDSSTLEIFISENKPYKDRYSMLLPIDGNYYVKLSSGLDYRVNYSTGVVSFLRPISSQAKIFAAYNLFGKRLGTSDPSARFDVIKDKIFVFLKYGENSNEDINRDYSQDADYNHDGKVNYDVYEIRSAYYLGSKKIKQDNFRINLFKGKSLLNAAEKSSVGKFNINYDEGVIFFLLREPFKNLLPENMKSRIYSESQPGDVYRYSQFTIAADYYSESRLFQLKHTNIIPDSVTVKINGKKISKSEYKLNPYTGQIEFSKTAPIFGDDSDVEIRYEYAPFGSNANAFIGGARADYRVNRNLSIGGTMLYATSPMVSTVPDVGNEPEANVVLETDATVYFGPSKLRKFARNLTGRKFHKMPFDVKGYFEGAHSVLYTNTFGKAMIDNMESPSEITEISLSEKEWVLSSLPNSKPQNHRGKLFYKYYRKLSDIENLRGDEYSPYKIDYRKKTGPYNVAESHRYDYDKSDRISLVLDFDLSNEKNSASIATRSLSDSPMDFSGLQYVEVYYKSAGGAGDVQMSIDVGTLNEDTDGDGVLDTEDVNNNGYLDYDPSKKIIEDKGFLFNPPGEDTTIVGGGPRLNPQTRGDGRLNTEDINRNGVLDTTETVVTMPGAGSYVGGSNSGEMRINLGDNGWKKTRIYLDRRAENFTADKIDILKKVSSVRINITANSPVQGIIYIDQIKFISSSWKDVAINGLPDEDSSKFKITVVDTVNDPEYRADSFIKQKQAVHESLYGSQYSKNNISELESALQVDYADLRNGSASAEKRFIRSLDLRHYETLNAWFNFKEFTLGDIIRIYLGSSDEDYIMYEYPITVKNLWENVRLRLTKKSRGNVKPAMINGEPNLRKIKFMKIEVEGNEGKFWLDNIYVSEPKSVTDNAYWCEGEINSHKPITQTADGRPVGSKWKMKYIHRGHGYDYVSPGRSEREMSERVRELQSSISILPNLLTDASVARSKNYTDDDNENYPQELCGTTYNTTMLFNTIYISPADNLPNVEFSYRQTKYDNNREDYITSLPVGKNTFRDEFEPCLRIDHNIRKFLYGSLFTAVDMNLLFSDQYINWISDEKSQLDLKPRQDYEYQKNKMNYSFNYNHKYFFIKPDIRIFSGEAVKYTGYESDERSQILKDVNGGFHFPIFNNGKNMKYFERGKDLNYTYGIKPVKWMMPQHSIKLGYSDFEFKDYQEFQRHKNDVFTRNKKAETEISNGFKFPFYINSKDNKYLKNITLSYERKLRHGEEGIPYEKETVGFQDEQYGASRVGQKLSGLGFNFSKFPPWYSFTGRNNYAKGRDIVYSTRNNPLEYSDGTIVADYNNSLNMNDIYNISSNINFKNYGIYSHAGTSQMSERFDIQSIPQQLVSYNAGSEVMFNIVDIFNLKNPLKNLFASKSLSLNLTLGYVYTRNLFITSNLIDNIHTPSAGISAGIDHHSVTIKGNTDFRHRIDREFIVRNNEKRPAADDKYFNNLPMNKLDEYDKSYYFFVEYKKDVFWIYKQFSKLYKLSNYPEYSISYELILNRYDYSTTVSPEPYDQHLVTNMLTMDLHKNIQGGIIGRWALERLRNRETGGISQEITSVEVGFNLLVIF